MNRELWAALLVLVYSALCGAVFARHRRQQMRTAAAAAALLPSADAAAPFLVLHGSQTGEAEDIAWQTARALHLAGLPVRVASLGETTLADLQAASHALFITSTYGEGDAPDSAARFVNDVMTPGPADLAHLQVGVMALGDRTYTHFCGFGRALDAWLRESGANAMFQRIEVDRGDEAALALWRQNLSHLAGTAELPEWSAAPFEAWRLEERRLLNPGSQGGPVFHLEFSPNAGTPLPDWEAGDLVQLQLESDAAPREYTIASLPADGRVHLMVRQSRRADGSVGLASGLLTQTLALGGSVPLRIRAHKSFRIGTNAERPLILVGNGTGLAGLRAHLKALEARGGKAAWLIFGERQSAHDAHYADEIEAWQRNGQLRRVDLAFSREDAGPTYVQHALAAQRETLLEAVANGAAIYVCGSLQGMAAGVDQVLREVLSDALVDEMTAQGRYRRDVY
ncbi:MAG TPA: sulfite reductase subunit alpha [Burkholderiaceae bacterium]|jgi:sulfite reductase (NADPH) flavoprotein alpha-component